MSFETNSIPQEIVTNNNMLSHIAITHTNVITYLNYYNKQGQAE